MIDLKAFDNDTRVIMLHKVYTDDKGTNLIGPKSSGDVNHEIEEWEKDGFRVTGVHPGHLVVTKIPKVLRGVAGRG